jgi:hypothetical protein
METQRICLTINRRDPEFSRIGPPALSTVDCDAHDVQHPYLDCDVCQPQCEDPRGNVIVVRDCGGSRKGVAPPTPRGPSTGASSPTPAASSARLPIKLGSATTLVDLATSSAEGTDTTIHKTIDSQDDPLKKALLEVEENSSGGPGLTNHGAIDVKIDPRFWQERRNLQPVVTILLDVGDSSFQRLDFYKPQGPGDLTVYEWMNTYASNGSLLNRLDLDHFYTTLPGSSDVSRKHELYYRWGPRAYGIEEISFDGKQIALTGPVVNTAPRSRP